MSRLKSPQSELDTAPIDSNDSFNWLGDDRDATASDDDSLETPPIDGIDENKLLQSDQPQESIFQWPLYRRLATHTFLFTLATLLAKCFGLGSPRIYGVQLYVWVLYGCLKVFLPMWILHVLDGVDKHLRIHPRLSKTIFPALFLAIRTPLILMILVLLYAPLWFVAFPSQCASKGFFCPFNLVLRVFIFVFASGVVTAIMFMLMILLRNNFQRKSFKDKMKESRFKMHLLEELSLLAQREKTVREHEGSDTRPAAFLKSDSGQPGILDTLLFVYPRLFIESAVNLVLPSVNALKGGDLGEQGKRIAQQLQHPADEGSHWKTPQTDKEAKDLARMIFNNLAPRGGHELTLADFLAIIPTKETATEAYYLFDADRDGSITRVEFRAAVVRIVHEHRNLMLSLANAGSVLSILDKFSYGVAATILFLLLLALAGVNIGALMGVVASFALSLNFIISDAANKTFHSLVMLFVVHPYDVGDRLVMTADVGFSSENILTVIAINIQNTVFRHWNGDQVTIPNHILALTPLTNLSRNTEQWERLELAVRLDDGLEAGAAEQIGQVESLKGRIDDFLGENPRDFYSSFELRAINPADTGQKENQLQIIYFVLNIRCKETQNTRKQWGRRLKLMAFLRSAIKSLKGLRLVTEQ